MSITPSEVSEISNEFAAIPPVLPGTYNTIQVANKMELNNPISMGKFSFGNDMIPPPPYLQNSYANYNPELVRIQNTGFANPPPYYPSNTLEYDTNPVTVQPMLRLTPSIVKGGMVVEKSPPLSMLPSAGTSFVF